MVGSTGLHRTMPACRSCQRDHGVWIPRSDTGRALEVSSTLSLILVSPAWGLAVTVLATSSKCQAR